jgi:mono/diheme cytochrome c family protein
MPDQQASADLNRGAYLVKGAGRCTECHSARNVIGGIVKDTEFAGAPNPTGKGTVPNITPSGDRIGGWSEKDIAYLLETGNTPDFDMIGESMAPVQENMAKLTPEDRKAIAAYIKSLPPAAGRRAESEEGGGQVRAPLGSREAGEGAEARRGRRSSPTFAPAGKWMLV